MTKGHASLLAGVVTVVLSLSALWQGLRLDDYHHRAALLGLQNGGYNLRGDPWHLYTFLDGTPAHTHALIEAGHVPWWADPPAKISFFRPISALTQIVDYRLWPNHPWLMHAQSLVWLFAVVVAVGVYYRRLFGVGTAAALAVLLFAIDDAHAVPAGWIAQRNTLVAVFFGVLVLLTHHRLRNESWRWGALAAPTLLAMSLLSGESGIGTLAYLVAYAAFLDPRLWRGRLASLLPYIGVVAIWRFATSMAGYGTANIDFYIDPGLEPLRFLSAAVFRLPILFVGLFTPIESNSATLGPPGSAQRLFLFGVAAILLLGTIMWPLIRRDKLSRFFSLGMILSLVPFCATYPHNRVLMWSSVGAMGLIARYVTAYFSLDVTLLPQRGGYRLAAAPFVIALVVVHGIVAPIQKTRALGGTNALRDQLYVPAITDPAVADRSIVIVNGPLAFCASQLQVMQGADGHPVPKHTRILAPSFAGVHLERPDERTLIVRPEGGFLAHPLDLLFRSRRRPPVLGYQVRLSDITITVAELTRDGRPASIACRFDMPLEDASLQWFCWKSGRYVEWAPPIVGGSEYLSPAIPKG